ncbi:MAG: heavy metal translocating P-type ATPase [Anaerolineales bacterium]
MTEITLELEIPSLLPDVEDDRLEAALQDHRGILRAHLEREKTPVNLCLHYDPGQTSLAVVRRMAIRAGAEIANRYHHELLAVEGMDCSDCALVLEHSLGRKEGVLSVNVNYAAQTMRVEYDSKQVNRTAIEKHVRHVGYRIPAEGLRSWYAENRELLFSILSGVLLLVGWVGERFLGFPSAASLTLYAAAYALGGYDVTRHALHHLRERHFDTDLLMVIAALGAATLGEFAEGALLLFLFSLGHVLEEQALDKARNAIRVLGNLAPRTALVQRESGEEEVAVDSLEIGELVIVRPGVRVPVDGEILRGHSGIDQSPVTGESTPVDKGPGGPVFAGSVNGEGALEVRVTRLARDSTLARVVQLVAEAQTQKSPTQQLTEKFSRVFVPAVLIGDALLILIPPLFGVPFAAAFLRAMTLLVAASPCALALGTPAAILSGVAQAARNGVLVKGGVHLENLGRLRAIAFDKTGTITMGEPTVTDVVVSEQLSVAGQTDHRLLNTDHLLRLAAAVESRSAHPLAQAVVRAAAAQGLDVPEAAEAEAATGRGIIAEVAGQAVWVGNLKLFDEAGIDMPETLQAQVRELEDQGKTTMVVGVDGRPVGLIAVADVLRPDAEAALASLKRASVQETVMLTGDNARVAAHIAGQVGLSNYRADLLPEDKLTAIRDLADEHAVVAMVGDGVNDAPALAQATVGIAMGGAGTDVALETADVALMADDLSKLPFAVGLGRATRAIIKQNLFIALGVIAVLMISSVLGLATIGGAIVLHEGSTIVVALNALRLLGYHVR